MFMRFGLSISPTSWASELYAFSSDDFGEPLLAFSVAMGEVESPSTFGQGVQRIWNRRYCDYFVGMTSEPVYLHPEP